MSERLLKPPLVVASKPLRARILYFRHSPGRISHEIKRQSSSGSTASGRRRVTPESPARRPRGARVTGRSTPLAAYQYSGGVFGRASPSDSPIMQTGHVARMKQPMRVARSDNSSVVSSESSASSSIVGDMDSHDHDSVASPARSLASSSFSSPSAAFSFLASSFL